MTSTLKRAMKKYPIFFGFIITVDKTLIKSLQKDARTSFKEIANQCNTALYTIKNRYKRLRENEVIYGSTIVIDPKKQKT